MDGCIALGVYRYSQRGWWFPAVYKQWIVEVFNFDSAFFCLSLILISNIRALRSFPQL
jgi:hypothetical protein